MRASKVSGFVAVWPAARTRRSLRFLSRSTASC